MWNPNFKCMCICFRLNHKKDQLKITYGEALRMSYGNKNDNVVDIIESLIKILTSISKLNLKSK